MSIDHERARDLEAARRRRVAALASPPDTIAAREMAHSLTEDQWPIAHMLHDLAAWIDEVTE